MRFPRLMAALLAVIVATGLGLATTTTAANAAKPPHVVKNLKAKTIKVGKVFQLSGRIPTYKKNRKVVLQRNLPGKGGFKRFRTDRTDQAGRFKIRFDSPVGSCFRLYVPGTTTYAKVKIDVGCVTRRAR